MFEGEFDLAWDYAPFWEEMRELIDKMQQIDTILRHPHAEKKNYVVDSLVQNQLIKVRTIANNWIYDRPQDYEPDETPN